MSENKFDLDSGELCLDLANTVDWHDSDQPEDRLHDYADLVAFGEAAGILTAGPRAQLTKIAEEKPADAAAAFARGLSLRDVIYRIFVDFSERGTFSEKDLKILNGALAQALSHLKLNKTESGFAWEMAFDPDDLDQVILPAVRSAGELLTSDRLTRVRQCADDRGCGYLFIDTSRNRSRRWCSMETCGNRAKARRHYRRQQNESAPSNSL